MVFDCQTVQNCPNAQILGRTAAIAICGLLLQTEQRGLSACLCVCLLVAFVSPAKKLNRSRTIWRLTRVGPRNNVLNGVKIPPREGAILGVVRPIEKHWESLLLRTQQRGHSIMMSLFSVFLTGSPLSHTITCLNTENYVTVAQPPPLQSAVTHK